MEFFYNFIELNFTGPKRTIDIPLFTDKLDIDINNETLRSNLERVDLLIHVCNTIESSLNRLHVLYVLQQCLEEPSGNVYDEMVACYAHCQSNNQSVEEKIQLQLLRFHIEVYHSKSLQITRKETMEYIDTAITLSNLQIELTGAKGKRTKFQIDSKMQMIAKISRSNELKISNPCTPTLPENIQLDHDVLLDKLTLDEPIHYIELSPLEQCVVLSKAVLLYDMQAKDDINNEQILPLLSAVIDSPKNWGITTFALLMRSRVEMSKVKTMERALLQYEQINREVVSNEEDTDNRVSYLNCIGMPCHPQLQLEIADHYMRFGALKSALDIYRRFNAHEKVVGCLSAMDMLDDAEEYILLILKESKDNKRLYATLLCYLGDCRKDYTLYLEAWDSYPLPLAQFRLGQHYYQDGLFDKAYDAYLKGLNINPLKPRYWYIAGCCALRLERFEDAVLCFRRTTALDDNPEAWNNLATSLLSLNRDSEAQHALMQAIKDSSSWKVWMNYLYVSMLCNELQESIRAGLKVFQLITPKWEIVKEQPDFEHFSQLITKTIDDLKRNDNVFLEQQLFLLIQVMIEKSAYYRVYIVASKVYIAIKDYKNAFKMIECGYRDLKDLYRLDNDVEKFNLLCHLGVELYRIATMAQDEVLKQRATTICTMIKNSAIIDTDDLQHLKAISEE